jgi:hypothetical protein
MNWKGELAQAVTFYVMPLLGALLAFAALRTDRLDRLDRRRWAILAASLFLVTRIGTHLVVFGLFRYPGGHDLLEVWKPAGEAALSGGDPWRHLDNLYGPLFPRILALGLWLSGTGPGIDVPFIAADGAALVLLLRIARRAFPEETARRLTLAVLLSPLLWHGVTVRSQDEPMFAMFLLLALDLVLAGRHGWAALAAALGSLCTKAIFPLWVLPVLLAPRDGWRSTAVRVALAAGLTVVGFGALQAAGWGYSTAFHPVTTVRGTSLWLFLPAALRDSDLAVRAGLGATAMACAGAALACARAPGPSAPVHRAALGVVLVQAVFFVVCPFTLPPHLVHGLPFLAWQAVAEGAAEPKPPRAALLLAGLLCAWQVPAVALNAERWVAYPWLVVLFVATWAWTGWRACGTLGRPGTTT